MVVYDTSFGDTKTVGQTIAETLKESGVTVDFYHLKDVKKLNGREYDFLVVGSQTRMGTMSLRMRSFLGRMKTEEWTNNPFAAFDTENRENLASREWSAAEKIGLKLLERGMHLSLPAMRAVVTGTRGPLEQGEIERTRDFAKQLAGRLSEKEL